jgi:ubiquinol-cytochrome c reductase iron-sulfur subunit
VPVNYDPVTQTIICPAHNSIFDPANGAKVLQGPALKPLTNVTVSVNADGTITTA